MPGPKPESLRALLAAHVACGGSVKSFANVHPCSARTCYTWLKQPDIQTEIEKHRKSMIDQTVGYLTAGLSRASRKLVDLTTSKSEPIALAASRAIVSDFVTMANFASVSAEMAELKRRVEAMEEAADGQRARQTP